MTLRFLKSPPTSALHTPLNGVFGGIFYQLVGHGLGDVNGAVVGQLQQVQQHVGHLVGNVFLGGWVMVGGL
jgi:hypothetical protein